VFVLSPPLIVVPTYYLAHPAPPAIAISPSEPSQNSKQDCSARTISFKVSSNILVFLYEKMMTVVHAIMDARIALSEEQERSAAPQQPQKNHRQWVSELQWLGDSVPSPGGAITGRSLTPDPGAITEAGAA
jgi:hypothetical protein